MAHHCWCWLLARIASGVIMAAAWSASHFIPQRFSRKVSVLHIASVTDANGNTTNYVFDNQNRLIQQINPTVAVQTISDFQSPQIPSGTQQAEFASDAGLAANGSPVTGGLKAAVGDQTAYFPSGGFTQRLVATLPGQISIGLLAAQAPGNPAGESQQITVTIYGPIPPYTYVITPTSSAYQLYSTPTFSTEGSFAINVMGTGPAGTTALINEIQILARPTITFQYDNNGNLVSQTDPKGNTTTYQYDALNRKTKMIAPTDYVTTVNANGAAVSGPVNPTTTYGYDANGNQTSVTDPNGNKTAYQYNSRGELTQTIQPAVPTGAGSLASGVTSYAYDANGNLIAAVDPKGDITQYQYDSMNRKIAEIDPAVAVTTVRGAGVTLTTNENPTITYQYDLGGNLVSTTDAQGNTTAYIYNALNQKTGEILPEATGSGSTSQTFTSWLSRPPAPENVGESVALTAAYFDTSSGGRINNPANLFSYGINLPATSGLQSLVLPSDNSLAILALDLVTSTGQVVQVNLSQYFNAQGIVNDGTIFSSTGGIDGKGNAFSAQALGPGLVFDGVAFNFGAPDQNNVVLADGQTIAVPPGQYQAAIFLAANTASGSTTQPIGFNFSAATNNTYDANGNLVSVTDPNGNTTRYLYDALNRRTDTVNLVSGTAPSILNNTFSQGAADWALSGTYGFLQNSSGAPVALALGAGASASQSINVANTGTYSLALSAAQYQAGENLPLTVTLSNGTQTYSYLIAPGGSQVLTDYYTPAWKLSAGNWTLTISGLASGGSGFVAVNNIQFQSAIGTSYTYHANGNQTSVTDPNGNTTTYTYDAMNRKTVEVAPAVSTTVLVNGVPINQTINPTTIYTYDANGNLVSVTDPNGNTTTYSFDSLNELYSVMQPQPTSGALDPTTTYGYDANGNQTSVTDANGNTTGYIYNALNEKIASIGAAIFDAAIGQTVNPTTTYTYDVNGNQTSVTSPNGNAPGANPAAFTTFFTYNQLNEQTAVIQPPVVDPTTGLIKNPTTGSTYDANGNLSTTTDQNGNTTSYKYDAMNRKVAEIDAAAPVTTVQSNGTVNTTTIQPTTYYQYDSNGNLIAVTDANLNTTTYTYNALNEKTSEILPSPGVGLPNRVTSYTYDSNGNATSMTDANLNITTYTYNALNEKTSETLPSPGSGLGNPITTYTYDNNGNQTSITDANGNTTYSTFDAINELTAVIQPPPTSGAAAPITTYTYDLNGNQLTVTDPDHNVTTYTYNAANQQITELLPAASVLGGSAASGVVSSAYDANGNLVGTVNADGLKTSWLYDNLDRQTGEIQYGLGNGYINDKITSTYDLGGRLVSVSDAASTTTYTYDQLNRVTTETITRQAMLGSVVLYHRYDANGNTAFTYMTINGVYDLFNCFTYNAENQVVSQRQFDLTDGQAAGLIPFISGTPTANTVAQKRVNYSYDSNGNMTAMNSYSDLAGTQLVATTTYTYNTINTLTGMVVTVNTNSGPSTQNYSYSYDLGGRLTQQVTPDGTSNFTYDHDNQLLTDSTGSGSYTYDSNGNRTSVNGTAATVGAGNQMAVANGNTYAYDQSGNLSSQSGPGGNNYYLWDNLNRLREAVVSAGFNNSYVQYYYDSQNRLITRSATFNDFNGTSFTNTQTNQEYIWDGGNLLAVLNLANDGAATVGQRFLTGAGQNQILAQENANAAGQAGQTLWAVTDNNGSVVDVVGNNGSGNAILNHIVYDSFGNTTSQTNSAFAMLMGFDGYIQDSVTGLYYANARFYSAQMGRFINQDPSGFSAGDSNLYRFVGNHPTYATDPTGLYEGGNGNTSGNAGIPTVTTYGSGSLDALAGGGSYGGGGGGGLGGAITGPTASSISPGLYAGLAGSGGGYGGGLGSSLGGGLGASPAANPFGQMNAGNNTLSFMEPGSSAGGDMAAIANSLGNMAMPPSLTSGGNNLANESLGSFAASVGLGTSYGDSAYGANAFSNAITLAGGIPGVGISEQQRTMAAMGAAGFTDLVSLANPYIGVGQRNAAQADLQWLAIDYNNAGLGTVSVAPISTDNPGGIGTTLFAGGYGLSAAVGSADVQQNGYLADPSSYFQDTGLQSTMGPYGLLIGDGLGDLAMAGVKSLYGRLFGAVAGDAVDGAAGQILSPRTISLNVLNPEFTPYASDWLQNATDRASAELGANPGLAQDVLSEPEYKAGQNSIGIARMQYGNAVEARVAQYLREDPLAQQMVKYTGSGPGPDFTGVGHAAGQTFDISTALGREPHWMRPYGAGMQVITYSRPSTFTVFPPLQGVP